MKTQINSILIPTDFSALSESALKVGIAIAKRQNAKITLLHVLDKFSYIQPTEVFLPDFGLTPDMVLTMDDRLKEMAEKIHLENGIDATGLVLDGQPADRICKYAYQEKFSLIVMGTHGTSGLREFFIGSEAFRVVKNATCPVLTIPGDWKKTEFRKILLPVRLKPGATDKYYFSAPLIEKNNSEIYLLGLTDMNKPGDIADVAVLMDTLKLMLRNDTINFQSAFSPCLDFPAKVFEVATEFEADLIVLTANLDYDLKAYFVGTFAQQVINHSRLPVLSIKPKSAPILYKEQFERSKTWGKTIGLQLR